MAIIYCQLGHSQVIEETYPKTIWSANDSFFLKFADYPEVYPYTVSRKNNESPGTDAAPGLYVTLYFGKDSLRLNYHNQLPYAHIFYINFESPKGRTRFRFHFNEIYSFFPREYVEKNQGSVQFEMPEPYELANIIWTISPCGEKAKDLNKQGEYYEKVLSHFRPYLDHPVFAALRGNDSLCASRYYEFRENSFAFNFNQNGQLEYNGPYYFVYGNEFADSSVFGKLKPLVEDFAAKSGFRNFYKANKPYYERQMERQKQLLPVTQMWKWLEDQFPNTKYNSYKIVSSPLIGGSHSTQNYTSYLDDVRFAESVMFIAGTERYDKNKKLNEKQKEGLMSGIVFTEIDHNYVNPATRKYRAKIDSIFSKRDLWTLKGSSADFYQTAVALFNEYLTHAVFCLYVLDHYDAQTAAFIIQNRESLMAERRGFTRFAAFNQELVRLKKKYGALKVSALYSYILDWCAKQ